MDPAVKAAINELAAKIENAEMIGGFVSSTEVTRMEVDPFSRAALRGDLEPFTALVDMFANTVPQADYVKVFFNTRDKEGFTLLHMAAVGGKTKVIEYLLTKGEVDIDIKDSISGETALHIASAEGHYFTARYLLGKGEVDIDIKDSISGETALHIASAEGHYFTARYLLGKGADPNAVDQKRGTPLHYAAEFGNKKLILLLISKGAKLNSVFDWGTPLHVAVLKGSKDSMKVLLEKHASPNVMSPYLVTPLITSIEARSNEFVKMLLKAGADPNIRGSKGMTSLGWAASQGDIEIIKCLLKARADPNITDNLGMTPLEVAALEGHHHIVMVLFPVTSPIQKIPEWNIEEIVNHVQSDEARQERNQKMKDIISLAIARGADSLKSKDYFEAARHYTEAIYYDHKDAILLSKRSLCYSRLNEGDLAKSDAQACLIQKPQWPKAHLRVGEAFMVLRQFDIAATTFQNGLKLNREDEELRSAFREALEAKRKQAAWAFGPKSIDAPNR